MTEPIENGRSRCVLSLVNGRCVEATEPHTCPYSVEINDNTTTLCTCCEACQRECELDI